jgi:pilus assembly protein CpaE
MEQLYENKSGKIIAVCSAKGGVGQTMIASNLAVALSKEKLSIALVDGKLQFGDIAVTLDIRSAVTIKNVADDLDTIDGTTISNYMTKHVSGLHVLPAPERLEYAELITKDVFSRTIALLQEQYDFVIIDCGYPLGETMIEQLDNADEIMVITTLNMVSLKNTKQLLEILTQLNFTNKTQLIINRHNEESLIKAADIPAMLNIDNVGHISNDPKLVDQSLNIGIPIVNHRSRSAVAMDLFKLAKNLVSSPSLIEDRFRKKTRKRLFSRKK